MKQFHRDHFPDVGKMVDATLRAEIDAAIAAGRVRRFASGVRALADRAGPSPVLPLVAAEQCLGGRQVERLPGLDQYDAATI